MKKIIVLFLISFSCYSQISGTIYNEQNLPLENVSVFLLKNNDTVSTALSYKNGFFEFKNISETEDIKLIISHISYETLRTKPVKEKTYFLVLKQYLIESVSVKSQKKEKKHIANRIFNRLFYGSIHLSYDCELAVFIPATDKNRGKKIKSLKYQLIDLKGDLKNNKYQPFRACIYTVDTITKEPKKKIFRSEKIRMTENEKWFYVNIDSLDIKMSEKGLFVAFETITREEANSKQIQVKDKTYDVIPTMRTKLYNPINPNKSYWRLSRNYWKFDKNFHYCMEFEFED